MTGLRYTTTSDDAMLQQILDLQRVNLEANQSPRDVSEQGFVTVQHDLGLLRDMNQADRHIVAIDHDTVVGYALVMLPAFQSRIPILEPMYERLSTLKPDGLALGNGSYFIMGQVCVVRSHRGQGIFDGMYRAMADHYRDRYQWVITEVALRNGRSLAAHRRVGFQVIDDYNDEHGEQWAVIGWDWQPPRSRRASP